MSNWYTAVGIGSDGVEMLVSKKDAVEASETIRRMDMRARFNSHRSLNVFCYLSDEEVTWEHFENKSYRALVEGRRKIKCKR